MGFTYKFDANRTWVTGKDPISVRRDVQPLMLKATRALTLAGRVFCMLMALVRMPLVLQRTGSAGSCTMHYTDYTSISISALAGQTQCLQSEPACFEDIKELPD